MPYSTLRFETEDGLARITLCRPDGANALDLAMAEELYEVALACSADPAVRAVLLTGEGRMFCAGGDLKAFAEQGDEAPAFVTRVASLLHAALTRFAYMDPPLVIAVNGTAAGAGFSIVLSGDYVIASEEAKLVSAYTASGLSPDGSSTYHLAKHVGLLRAKELMLANRVLSAAEALDWGLVTRVVPAAALAEEATAMARRFAAGPTRALGETKRLLLQAADASLESQLDAETRAIARMIASEDGWHGLNAFLAKQKPVYKGR